MVSFEKQVEGLTQIDITTSSAPTQNELSQHFKNAVRCTINKIVAIKPQEAIKFSSTSELDDSDGLDISGKILGVVRGQSSTTILKAATEIPNQLRYDATDIDSLRYRSSYNPAFYQLNGKLYVLPVPDSDSKGYITQLSYDSIIDATIDNSIENFPDEYLHLIVLYASALTCQSAASNLQNDLPSRPVSPPIPDFDIDETELPILPVYTPPKLNFEYTNITNSISKEDFDAAEKWTNLLDKKIELYAKQHEQQDKHFQKEMEVFKSDLDLITKNADREMEKLTGEYRSNIYKYQYDIMDYSQALQERFTKYKWFMEQYVSFMNEYNENIMMMMGRKQSSKSEPPKSPKPPKQEREE